MMNITIQNDFPLWSLVAHAINLFRMSENLYLGQFGPNFDISSEQFGPLVTSDPVKERS